MESNTSHPFQPPYAAYEAQRATSSNGQTPAIAAPAMPAVPAAPTKPLDTAEQPAQASSGGGFVLYQPDQPTVEGSLATPPATPNQGATYSGGAYGAHSPYGTYGGYNGSGTGNGMMTSPPAGTPSRRGRGVVMAVSAGVVVMLLLALGAFALGRANGSNSGNPASAHNSAPTVAVPASAQDLQQTVINVVKTDQPSVVEVTSQGSQGEAIGSGVIIRSDGYIVTNDHVVNGFSTFTVTLSSGSQQTAQVVGVDPNDDLAVLKISASNLRAITLANSSNVQVGEFDIALGNPLGLQQSATFGIVSALNRTATEDASSGGTGATLTGLIQTSAPINPGNSGGALVDLQGQLIGIPTLGATNTNNGSTADGIGFAIPSNRVSYVVNQLISNGHLTATGQGFLGVQSEDVTPQIAAANGLSVQSGVLVAGFSNDAAGSSPAQQAGIKVGDVITAVNGTQINNSDDLAGVLLNLTPGTKVNVTVERGSSQQMITVTLGERPANLNG